MQASRLPVQAPGRKASPGPRPGPPLSAVSSSGHWEQSPHLPASLCQYDHHVSTPGPRSEQQGAAPGEPRTLSRQRARPYTCLRSIELDLGASQGQVDQARNAHPADLPAPSPTLNSSFLPPVPAGPPAGLHRSCLPFHLLPFHLLPGLTGSQSELVWTGGSR